MTAVEVLAIVQLVVAMLLAALVYRLAARLRGSEEWANEAIGRLQATLDDRVLPSLDQLRAAFDMAAQAPTAVRKPADLSNLSTTDLLDQMREAKKLGDADEVLDLRDLLGPRLDAAKRDKMDGELAGWFTKHFQTALRSGKAALIAPALGRAVESLGSRPEIQHLADALPTIRQSVGLCPACGKPYRGTQATCPQCTAENSNGEYPPEDDGFV